MALQVPWVEQYRPRLLADVVGNRPVMDSLTAMAEAGRMPNLILTGPPGTGKTTSVVCLVQALLGPAAEGAVLELNASDDRGTEVVRTAVTDFAKKRVSLPPGRCKVVVLDEADNMTEAAQYILLRVMELHQDTTRFALACNDSTKLVEGIQSRCTVLRFARLMDEDVAARVEVVCEEEGLEVTPEGLQALVFVADGDMRHALNTLQAAAATGTGEPIARSTVLRACDHPDPDVVKLVLDVGWADSGSGLHAVLDAWEALLRAGYSAVDILDTLHRLAKTSPVLPPFVRLEVLKSVGQHSARAKAGLVSVLQVLACACEVYAMCRTGRAATADAGFAVPPLLL